MTAAPATAEAATAATFPIPVAIFEPVERVALVFVEVFARTAEDCFAFGAAFFGAAFLAAGFFAAGLLFAGAGRFAFAGFAAFFGLALDFAIGLGVRSEFQAGWANNATHDEKFLKWMSQNNPVTERIRPNPTQF
jgi:hypothetical protein